MTWLTEARTETTNDTSESIWVKFEPLQNLNDNSQIPMRVLGGDPTRPEEPAGVWTHWLASKPYNCAGMENCAVCQARMQAMRDDPANYKKRFQLSYKYFFNVLVNEGGPKVKIFSFGSGLGKKLKAYQEEYGDLRDYDIKVRKTKVGNRQQDVEYDPFVLVGKSMFTPEQVAEAKTQLHDLQPFIQPAPAEMLEAVARGEAPEGAEMPSKTSNDTASLLVQLEDIAAKRELTLGDLDVGPATPQGRLLELITLLDKRA